MFSKERTRCPKCRFVLVKRGGQVLSCSRCRLRFTIHQPKVKKRAYQTEEKAGVSVTQEAQTPPPSLELPIKPTASGNAVRILREEMAHELSARALEGRRAGAQGSARGDEESVKSKGAEKDIKAKDGIGVQKKRGSSRFLNFLRAACLLLFCGLLAVFIILAWTYAFAPEIKNLYPPIGPFLDFLVREIDLNLERSTAFLHAIFIKIDGGG